jgi:hypothetical protein
MRETHDARVLERDLVVIDVHLVAEDRFQAVDDLAGPSGFREGVVPRRVVPHEDGFE